MKTLFGTLGLSSLLVFVALAAPAGERIPDEFRIGGIAMGCQAYSFNRFSAFEAIEKTAQAGGKVIEFYPGQKFSPDEASGKLDHNMPDAQIEKLKSKLAQHGVKAVNYGVVGLPNDEVECRKVFAFAKQLGLYAVTTEAGEQAMDLVERLAKEYDMRVAIHNHPRQPNNANYKHWDPQFVLGLVQNRDRRLGACADTGHWTRSGLKPVEALRILQGRIVSVHMKDLNEFKPSGHDVPFGTGVSDVAGVLDELKRQGFDGNVSLEYEYNWDHSVPEIAQCIGFVRGYTARSR